MTDVAPLFAFIPKLNKSAHAVSPSQFWSIEVQLAVVQWSAQLCGILGQFGELGRLKVRHWSAFGSRAENVSTNCIGSACLSDDTR